MSSFPSFAAGNQHTAQKLNDMQVTAIVATTAQTITNSQTFVDDNTLTVPVLAFTNYFIEFFMIFEQSSTLNADVKTRWSAPSGALGLRQVTGPSLITFSTRDNTNVRVAGHLLSTVAQYSIDLVAARTMFCIERASVNVGGTAGNVTIQWAQNGAQAQNLTRDANSFVRVTRFL